MNITEAPGTNSPKERQRPGSSDLGETAVDEIAHELRQLLADVFVLYMKTKNFHWHMSGPHFRDYHLLLDEQAGELFGMTDTNGNSALKLQTHHAAWPFFMVTGALAKARDHVSKGLALYRRDTHGEQALQYGGHDAGVCAYASDALLLAAMGYPDRAVGQIWVITCLR